MAVVRAVTDVLPHLVEVGPRLEGGGRCPNSLHVVRDDGADEARAGKVHAHRADGAGLIATEQIVERFGIYGVGRGSRLNSSIVAGGAQLIQAKDAGRRSIAVDGGCTPILNCSVIAIFSPRSLTSFSPFTLQLRCAHISGRYDGF